MDTKYDINITENAEKDLENIYFYISNTFSENEIAVDTITKLKEAVFSLDFMPSRYGLVNDVVLAKKGYRHIVVKNYIILYFIDEKKKAVNIARIIHGKMDYTKFI
jgi:addiction module RelE/StbE family toxin